jgi:hypothetical protein
MNRYDWHFFLVGDCNNRYLEKHYTIPYLRIGYDTDVVLSVIRFVKLMKYSFKGGSCVRPTGHFVSRFVNSVLLL